MKSYCFVVNPASRGGKNRRFLDSLKDWVQKNLSQVRWEVTERPGHAAALAARAAEDGFSKVISVGGDGTLHEVVNGLARVPLEHRPQVGLISSGTGGDFRRTLNERFEFPSGFEWLLQAAAWEIDLGRVEVESFAGDRSTHYFVNIADVGISGEVTRRVNASKRSLGSWEYLRSTIAAGWSYRAPRVRITGSNLKGPDLPHEMDLLVLVVANGRYFGGGMCIAPEADPADQDLDVMVAEQVPYLTLLKEIPNIYRKKRLRHPKIRYLKGSGIFVEGVKEDLPIGLDGEFLRARRARFEILPKALQILVPWSHNPKS